MKELRELQRAFARSVTRADEDDEPGAGILASLRSDREIPAAERLGVYVHAYFARLHDVLRDDYPALAALLGEVGFHDLVKLYLMAHPPRSFSLRFAGEALPGFLAGPVAEVFAARWPCAADLAALEWALVDVFDAPDAELLTRAALAQLEPGDWAGLRFSLVPAQRVLALGWPVQRAREAWSAGEAIPELAPRATRVLVYRCGESAACRALPAAEARALELVASGADFAALCAGVAEEAGDAQAAPLVLEMLECWLADGVLSAVC